MEHPELVKPFQEMIGCLMYCVTSTRPDVAYAVHQLCKCLQKPTPALIREAQHVLSYLARHSSDGLTFSSGVKSLFAVPQQLNLASASFALSHHVTTLPT